MKSLLFGLLAAAILVATTGPVMAQSMSSQINAVAQAQHRQEARRDAEREAAQRRWDEHEARVRARENAAAAAAARVAHENRSYVLEQRKLQIEQEELNLKAQSTLVGRENDIINSKLAREKAGTNLVQSRANANNNISTGEKTLLQDKGTAAINNSTNGKAKPAGNTN